MTIESRAKEKTQKILKTVRKVVYFGVLIGLVWFFLRYDFIKIPNGYNHLAPQRMPAGATVVAVDYDEDVHLGIGSVLLFEAPGVTAENKDTFGVVAGLPGEMVILLVKKPGAGQLQVADRKELLPLPKNHKINSGIIPDGYYLILNGDRHMDSGVGQADSRVFGLVPQKNLKAKIITALNPFSG